MGKIYTLDKKLLVGSPEIQIGDKLYPVDDRTSTVNKITKLRDKEDDSEAFTDEVFKLAFGNKYKEIKALDMPFKATLALAKLVMMVVIGEDEDEDARRFPERGEA